MTRPVVLASLKTGITRLREKGGANPQSLYDLVNGYVDESGSPTSRPGVKAFHAIGSTGTKGMTTFKGKVIVFANTVTDPGDARFQCLVLRHPTDPAALIRTIHYSRPIAGALYVIAEFDDDAVYHYWMQEAPVWQANTIYFEGQLVQPSVGNGFAYVATRPGEPNPVWAPGVLRAVNDIVEPTVANGYKFTVQSTQGDSPSSGTTEPTWNAEDDALTYEDVSTATPSTPTYPTPVTTPLPVDPGRYSNPGGTRPPNSNINEPER